jgi:5-methyltetrahydrofolate--homocysteine methyltransferase
MKLAEIRDILECEVLSGQDDLSTEVETVVASDGMSEILAFARPGALMLTGLTNVQSVRTADIANVRAIVYIRGKRPAEKAIELAREACAAETLLAADIGPSGLMFPPMGTATAKQLTEVFAEQVEAVAAAGADLVHIETMYDLREAEAAVAAAVAVGIPAFASMTFDRRRRGSFTVVGNRIGPSLNALAERGAIAVGMNCSVESEPMVAMVHEAVAEVQTAIVAQPNAGRPRVTATGVVYDASPEKFVADLMAMVEAGVRAVGGCCGTNPEFIAAARAALDTRERA